jgi:hypothetical protein
VPSRMPDRGKFLSTVQSGITLIGEAPPNGAWLSAATEAQGTECLRHGNKHETPIDRVWLVIVLTTFGLVIGELVPKASPVSRTDRGGDKRSRSSRKLGWQPRCSCAGCLNAPSAGISCCPAWIESENHVTAEEPTPVAGFFTARGARAWRKASGAIIQVVRLAARPGAQRTRRGSTTLTDAELTRRGR